MDKELQIEVSQRAIELMLDGDAPEQEILRSQMESATVSRIDPANSAGFYTHFKVNDSAPILEEYDWGIVGGLVVDLSDECTLGFILWIDHGIASLLECWTAGDPVYPNSLEDLDFQFLTDVDSVAESEKIRLPSGAFLVSTSS